MKLYSEPQNGFTPAAAAAAALRDNNIEADLYYGQRSGGPSVVGGKQSPHTRRIVSD